MTDNTQHALLPQASTDAARQRAAKADPKIPFANLWLNSSFGELDRIDAHLIAALAPTHPRAFWAIAKRHLFDSSYSRDNSWIISQACSGDERLLRLGLGAARLKYKSDAYRPQDMPLRFLIMALALPGQGDAWRSARIAENAALIASFSADGCFSLVSAAARSGHLAAAEQLAAMMPDKRLGELHAKKYRYGSCGFSHTGMGERAGQAWAEASVAAEACGRARTTFPANARPPINGLYWIAIRHHALRDSDPATSDRWARVGALLIEHGLEVEDGHEAIGLTMGCAPMLNALIERRPALGDPSFYIFRREESIFDAMLRARAADVAKICAYEETGSSCRTQTLMSKGASRVVVSPVPAAALALLAGHAPHSDWINMGADRNFKVPKSILEAAKASTLARADLARSGCFASGQMHTIHTLAAALGLAPKAIAKQTLTADGTLATKKPRSPRSSKLSA